MSIIPEKHYPATLGIWFTEKSDVCTENHLDTEIYTKLTKYLKKVFGKQNWNVTDPIRSKRTKWHHNHNFYGAYSYRGLVASKAGITNSDLQESLKNTNGKQTVLFAGEATHNEYYSTMHGAVESGIIAAEKIIHIHESI